jgi:uncharacterized RDD family membrane protein YckC
MTEQEASPTALPHETQLLAPHPESVPHLPSTASEIASEISGTIAEPWLRFFARLVDIQIWAFLLAFTAGLLLPSLFQGQSFLTGGFGSKLFGWLLIPFALAVDAVSYSLLGNTPGKWVAGIKVKSLAGDKVSFLTYLKRNFSLYWFGLGLDIPLVVLVTMWRNYSHAEGNETVRWDESTGTRAFVRAPSTPRIVAIGAIGLLSYVRETAQMISR